MHNRETILKKIEAQEQEWNKQINYLQTKVASFDISRRIKSEKYVIHLNSKLKTIETLTNRLRDPNTNVWDNHTDKIAQCWEELVHNVDFVIDNYKRIFNQTDTI